MRGEEKKTQCAGKEKTKKESNEHKFPEISSRGKKERKKRSCSKKQ